MPLVFVHGVNVRYVPGSDPFVQARDALFRRLVLSQLVSEPTKARIWNPYWGAAAAEFPWNHGGLPEGKFERLGADDLVAAAAINDLGPQRLPAAAGPEDFEWKGGAFDPLIDPDTILPALAAQSLEAALDALWVVAAEGLSPESAAEFAELSARAGDYALGHPRPEWALSAPNNDEFISRLFRTLETQGQEGASRREKFGFDKIKNALRTAGDRLRLGVARMANATGAGARRIADAMLLKVRTPVHRSVATFMGDVLVYFRQREAGGSEVARIVSAALEEANAERQRTGEPLIVVAHSMGGNIVYDLLTSTGRPWHVDTLVTVGSQVAVVEELKLFASSDRAIPNETTPKVSRPGNVTRWINVFDTFDVLGFAASKVFKDVEDYAFSTGHAWAHGGYFVEPVFHARLAKRLKPDV